MALRQGQQGVGGRQGGAAAAQGMHASPQLHPLPLCNLPTVNTR